MKNNLFLIQAFAVAIAACAPVDPTGGTGGMGGAATSITTTTTGTIGGSTCGTGDLTDACQWLFCDPPSAAPRACESVAQCCAEELASTGSCHSECAPLPCDGGVCVYKHCVTDDECTQGGCCYGNVCWRGNKCATGGV